jgi:hypothetical protein
MEKYKDNIKIFQREIGVDVNWNKVARDTLS